MVIKIMMSGGGNKSGSYKLSLNRQTVTPKIPKITLYISVFSDSQGR